MVVDTSESILHHHFHTKSRIYDKPKDDSIVLGVMGVLAIGDNTQFASKTESAALP